jgi:ABC-type dipeptide/oligopeptide/nickel transport system permease component
VFASAAAAVLTSTIALMCQHSLWHYLYTALTGTSHVLPIFLLLLLLLLLLDVQRPSPCRSSAPLSSRRGTNAEAGVDAQETNAATR